MEIKPIAYFHTRKKNPYEAARQGALDLSSEIGEIHFEKGQGFEQALDDIEGFSHIWLVYQFHHNADWKPKVLPPRGSDQKIGVFATRSPYRPNALGLSCVQLVARQGLILQVKSFDLLDGTPIFDIKPYIAAADSFPNASMGWLENIEAAKYEIEFSETALQQIQFLFSNGVTELENFVSQQLSYEPLNFKKKRVQVLKDGQGVLAYRTWRVRFTIEPAAKESDPLPSLNKILVQSLSSGYSPEDLSIDADPYLDKDLHRRFFKFFQ